jgi:hypothetical protein
LAVLPCTLKVVDDETGWHGVPTSNEVRPEGVCAERESAAVEGCTGRGLGARIERANKKEQPDQETHRHYSSVCVAMTIKRYLTQKLTCGRRKKERAAQPRGIPGSPVWCSVR